MTNAIAIARGFTLVFRVFMIFLPFYCGDAQMPFDKFVRLECKMACKSALAVKELAASLTPHWLS